MDSMVVTSIGLGLCVVGTGIGIGRLAAGAMESMARQPEMSSKIQTVMFITAALIEGVALFAIVLAMLKG